MMSWNAFSQNDIDSTKIQLTKPIAKLVIKDLIQFDGLSIEMQTMQSILTETNNKLLTQTDLVTNLKSQVNNLELVIGEKDSQLEVSKNLSLELEKALKKSKRRTFLYKLGTGVGAVAVGLLLVK